MKAPIFKRSRLGGHYSCKQCTDKWVKIGEVVEKERKAKGLLKDEPMGNIEENR